MVEKFGFNVDIVAAAAWQHPQQCTFIHPRSFIHFIQWEAFFFFVLYITSSSTIEIGRYLTYLNYLPQRKSAARGMIVGPRRLSGSLYVFLSDVIYTHALLTYSGVSKFESPGAQSGGPGAQLFFGRRLAITDSKD